MPNSALPPEEGLAVRERELIRCVIYAARDAIVSRTFSADLRINLLAKHLQAVCFPANGRLNVR